MRVFSTPEEASAFMAENIDHPISSIEREVSDGIRLTAFPLHLDAGEFANVYDVSWTSAHRAGVHVPSELVSVPDFARSQRATVTASGTFFVLADEASALPAEASIGLVVTGGRLRSLPVTDREALLCRSGRLSLAYVPAQGTVELNGRPLTWEGSRTGRVAECYAYGNGNAIVRGLEHPVTGKARVLTEASRWTPPLPPSAGFTDVAFRARDGVFISCGVAVAGSADIFSADLVMRCPAHLVHPYETQVLRVGRVGPLAGSLLPETAVTAGPSLGVLGLAVHPINDDLSRDDNVGFGQRRMSRMMLFATADGRTHLRVYDSRPGSATFTGVTPDEASAAVSADHEVEWGCFLDGGQTAKICLREPDGRYTTYGNRHYLRWPRRQGESFVWAPDAGRPVASLITIG